MLSLFFGKSLTETARDSTDETSFQNLATEVVPPEFEHRTYSHLLHLRWLLSSLDSPLASAGLTVVLQLHRPFAGDLLSLIRRRHGALRLILVTSGQKLPGLLTIGDLDSTSHSLGWRQIVLERELEHAIAGVVASRASDDRVCVVTPDWSQPPAR